MINLGIHSGLASTSAVLCPQARHHLQQAEKPAMTTASSGTVEFMALSDALDFVSSGGSGEYDAYISLDTGEIYWVSDVVESEQMMPVDLETSDRYIAVPHKMDLGLGRTLALSFTEEHLPNDYEAVAGFFRRRGAYRRFKDLLASRGMLEPWYDAENRATAEALRRWCEEVGIQLVEESAGRQGDSG